MKSIEIVTHCYTLERPHFLECLKYQLSSLLEERAVQVTSTVCYCQEDKAVTELLDWYKKKTKLKLRSVVLCKEQLSRRAIGRNLAALRTESGIVWFADADYVFLKGILGRLCHMEWPQEATMVYPKQIMITKDHETGDRLLKPAPVLHARYLNSTSFVPKDYNRAIGGVQIVQGWFARKHGYLEHDKNKQKWLTPTKEGIPFRPVRGKTKTQDDVAYRNYCKQHGKIIGIELEGIYRIRHST